MKQLSEPTRAALRAGAVFSAALELDLAAGVTRLWFGDGGLDVPGLGLCAGLRAPALLTDVGAEMGAGAGGVRLVLSQLEPTVAAALVGQPVRGRPARLFRLIFDPLGTTLLDVTQTFSGRCGPPDFSATIGGTAAVELPIESSALDLNRAGARVRSDADQRLLGGPEDASFAAIAISGERTLSWGAAPVTSTGRALPGVDAPSQQRQIRPGLF